MEKEKLKLYSDYDNKSAMPKTRFKLAHKLIIVITLLLMSGIIYLHIAPKPPLSSYYTSSTAVYARRGELLRLTLAKDQQYRVWTDLEDIPKNIQQATLLYEVSRVRWL